MKDEISSSSPSPSSSKLLLLSSSQKEGGIWTLDGDSEVPTLLILTNRPYRTESVLHYAEAKGNRCTAADITDLFLFHEQMHTYESSISIISRPGGAKIHE